jgi:hypothetical protein
MKHIDFTQPGGFPLTQDQLDYLQQSYSECISALAAMGTDGTGTPVIITGMVSSISGGTTTISAGWFFYNSELVRFSGGSYGTVPVGDVPLISITPSTGTLTYSDGSTPGVIFDKVAALVLAPAVTDATHFPFSSLLPYGYGFGRNNREQAWSSIAVSTAAGVGGVTGTIFYKKDFTANTLQIRGSLTANNAQNFAASPSSLFSLMGTFPAGYIPNNNVYFVANYFLSSLIKDDLGVAWIKQINCALNTLGQLYVNWIKPDIAVSGYGININAVLPLD